MLGLIYAMVAVGFTLFFGVLNVIQFAQLAEAGATGWDICEKLPSKPGSTNTGSHY